MESSNRAKLVRAARSLFTARGFADVSVDEIAAAAGVTKGAVYYQFKDKTDLFQAACEAALSDIVALVEAETMEDVEHTVDEIVTGAEKLFDAYESPEARRLLLVEGPVVLGLDAWTAMQDKLGVGLAEHALGHLAEDGRIPKGIVPMLARLMFGAFTQAVLQIATADEPRKASRHARAAYRRLAEGLLANTP
jgi:AcrR family transcriptional regulator